MTDMMDQVQRDRVTNDRLRDMSREEVIAWIQGLEDEIEWLGAVIEEDKNHDTT